MCITDVQINEVLVVFGVHIVVSTSLRVQINVVYDCCGPYFASELLFTAISYIFTMFTTMIIIINYCYPADRLTRYLHSCDFVLNYLHVTKLTGLVFLL